MQILGLPKPVFPAIEGIEVRQINPRHLLCLATILPACQNLAPPPPARTTVGSRGEAIAQRSCSGCHAVGRYGSSSNPTAPPFSAIANQEGLTRVTLETWLQGAHNYPTEMDFILSRSDLGEVAAYLLTLRDPNYTRPPD